MNYFAFQWHITEKCDQRCQHCYIYSAEKNMTFKETSYEQMVSIVDNCVEMCQKCERIPYFTITGGDPILHKDFWKLLELLHEKNIPFSILGNPFHLTSQICERLYNLGCQKYQLSIDGLEKTHDLIRRPGSYQCTLEAIDLIRQAGIKCAIMTTVSTTNLIEIPSIIDVVVEHNVDVFSFARYCPVSDDRDLMVSPDDYRDLLDKCWKKYELYQDTATSFNLKDHLWTLYLYEKGLFTIDSDLDEDVIYEGCNCAINHLTILPDGTVYACRRMESPVGNIFEKPMYDIFFSEELDEYRQFDKFEKCSKCELLRFCRGCPATTAGINGGNMYAPDPQCWKVI